MLETNKLIEDNMKLVYFVISRYFPTFTHDEDIIQTGMLGLVKAANSWDECKGEFSTYACTVIRNEINKEFRARKRQPRTVSLDAPMDADDEEASTFGDYIIGDTDVEYFDQEEFYDKLGDKGCSILELKKLGMHSKDIADAMGCSVSCVNWWLRKAKTLLR